MSSSVKYVLDRKRIDKIPHAAIVAELEKVARLSGYRVFRKIDFDKRSSISSMTVVRDFGSWLKAMQFLESHLRKSGLALLPRSKRYFSEGEMFQELERLWAGLGHRPSRTEWNSFQPKAKISYMTYTRHFGSWTNACLKFIEFKMGNTVDVTPAFDVHDSKPDPQSAGSPYKATYMSRSIPLKLRLRILQRDNFRCRFCGRSPATHLGVTLHMDHIIPFSKEGKTDFNNLQTLCSECNLGKAAQDAPKQVG